MNEPCSRAKSADIAMTAKSSRICLRSQPNRRPRKNTSSKTGTKKQRSPGVHCLFVSGGSLIRLHLTLRQMIEPRVFKDSGGPKSYGQSYGGAPKFLENNIQRQSDQANLPCDSHHDVEHIAEEIFVSLEAWVFRQYLLQDRTPKAPRPHTAVEVHQHRIVFRLG